MMNARIFTLVLLAASRAWGSAGIDATLEGNRAASQGSTSLTGTLRTDYALVGQGLTGTAFSIVDLKSGYYAEGYEQGPTGGGDGFDGKRPWMTDQSGAVTPEEGGDKLQLAINNAYRNANLWWRGDRGGAAIEDLGVKPADGRDFAVLKVTPKNGKSFEAWFDTNTHLLAKTVEVQGFIPIITTFADYRPESGIMLAHKSVSDSGGGEESLVTQTITRVQVSAATPVSAYASPAWSRADTRLDGKSTSIPFVLLNNHVFVEVMVNGKGPYRFIVDTGGHNIVTPSTVAALKLDAQGDAPAHGAGEATVSSGFAKVHMLRLGALTIRDQTMTVLDFDAPGVEGVRTDGMIGFEVFRRFVTTFDYAANRLTLTDPKSFNAATAGTPIKFKFYDHMPQIEGSIDGVAGRFNMDTGSRSELDLTKPFVESTHWRSTHPNGVLAVTGWGVGGSAKSYSVRGRELKLGGVSGDNLIIGLSTQDNGSFSDPNYEGNVGSGFLKRYCVSFDYDRQVMYLKPRARGIPDAGAFDRSGMWVNARENGGYQIVDVAAASPAQNAGLKVGDVIEAVDGKAVVEEGLSDFRRRLRTDPAGSQVKLKLARGAQPPEVTLTLADQI
jgi:hypothetical protein